MGIQTFCYFWHFLFRKLDGGGGKGIVQLIKCLPWRWWEPEFSSHNPHQRAGHSGAFLWSRCSGCGGRWLWELAGVSLDYLPCCRPMRQRFYLKDQGRYHSEHGIWGCLLASMCIFHTHVSACTWRHIYKQKIFKKILNYSLIPIFPYQYSLLLLFPLFYKVPRRNYFYTLSLMPSSCRPIPDYLQNSSQNVVGFVCFK